MEGKPSPRETAWRVFANELNSSTVKIDAAEEKMPSYVVTPLGAKVNRVLIAGTLIDKINSGTDDEPMWRARVQDVNGQFYINVGRFQNEAMVSMADLEPPCFIVAVGRVRSYSTEDGKIFISVRPERIVSVDESKVNDWLLETAKTTWQRLKWYKQAISVSDAKTADLINMGMSPQQAEGLLFALDNYQEMPNSESYIKTIQNALRRLLPDMDIDFGFPEGVPDQPDEMDIEGKPSGEASLQMEDFILALLEELDVDGKGAPRDELERRAEAEGISAIELEEISNNLMDKGLVYEPNLRYLKKI